ncbi:hypothetical protein L0657_23535 [Dyadobacter sp. CY345]|uniref:sialate O-acetylesterase n=1 Tax=Dyadobacter sp. CY345 TaxID=2909335 RepID=UPI001F3ABE76|nr:sialate O-acetylesterase [Dyadobacter sp. CY345]MCF2446947.1 hypothetical protein [Dyadobacter sp. CY345]
MKNIFTILLLLASNLVTGANITLTWPRNYSVFQRNTTSTGGSANVTFAGQLWNKNSASYRIEKLTATGASNGDWQSSTSFPFLSGIGSSEAATFNFVRNVPTGWYRLYISDGTNTINIKFGVGEVFIIAGQSNAQGAAAATNVGTISNLDCVVSNKNYIGSSLTSYQTLETPVFGVLNSGNMTIGPRGDRPWFYQSLGNQIAQRETGQVIPVCFFNVGHGGSSIDNWYDSMQRTKTMFSSNYANTMVPGTTSTHQNPFGAPPSDNRFPYIDLKNVVSAYGNMFGVRSIIWHQGESETKTLLNIYKTGIYNNAATAPTGYSLNNYDTKLNAIIADTRSVLPGLPWAISKVSLLAADKNAGGTDYDIVNNSGNNLTTPSGNTSVGNTVTQEQANVLSTTSVSYASANSDSYTNATGKRSDGTHFNSLGLANMSDDVYLQISGILSKTPVLSATPAGMGFSQNTTESYTLVTGNYSKYIWARDASADMSLNQGQSDMGNPWTSGISVDFTYKGWAKDFSGRITKIVPYFNVHGISGARIAAESAEAIAYPNPILDAKNLNISFSLTKASPLKLQIVTEQGYVLEQIIKPNLEAGKHNYAFSLEKLRANKNFSFVIYKLKTLEHSENKKIMLVK